jgi:DNA-binding XRE family transcriptional regulator
LTLPAIRAKQKTGRMKHDEDIPPFVRSTLGTISAAAVAEQGPVAESGGASMVATPGTAASSQPVVSLEPDSLRGRAAEATQALESSPGSVRGEGSSPGLRAAAAPDDEERDEEGAKPSKGKRIPNNVRRMRIERMMSKAELARRANLSVLTIDRVEKGYGCRMDSKRKILEALGLSLADRVAVFGEEE